MAFKSETMKRAAEYARKQCDKYDWNAKPNFERKENDMALKPKSRKHEDRLCKLECDLANMRNDMSAVANVAVHCSKRLGAKITKGDSDELVKVDWAEPLPRTFWQRLNAYLSR